MQPPPEPWQEARPVGVSIPVPFPHGPFLQAKRADYGDPMAATTIPHVTLLGPTTLDADGLAVLVGHLGRVAAAAEPFDLSLSGTGTFRPRSQVVYVRVVDGADACHELESAIRGGGYARCPDFPFHPHVTVAHDVDQPMLDKAYDELADYHVRFLVEEFLMYERDCQGVWQPALGFPLGRPSTPRTLRAGG